MQIETIMPGIRKVTPSPQKGSAWETPNVYLVGHDPLLMIDAGYERNFKDLLQAVAGARLQTILITHGHIDHAGAAWALKEATGADVISHPEEFASIERRFPGKKPDHTVTEGEVIEHGGFALELVLMPGHTPGHLCLLIKSENLVFSSDLVTGSGSTLVAPPEGNMKMYMESLKKLKAMRPGLLLPGHGPVVRDPASRIDWLIEHRELRELAIARVLSKGPSKLKGLVRNLYLGYIHPHMEGPAAMTAWAHLQKMIEDGSVKACPEGETNPFQMSFQLAPGVELPESPP